MATLTRSRNVVECDGYRARYTVRRPSPATEDKYMLTVPALRGCRAWGDTREQAYYHLQSVLAEFIGLYRERGWPLSEKLAAAS